MLGYKNVPLLEHISKALTKNRKTLSKLEVANSLKALAYFDHIVPATHEALLTTVISNSSRYDFSTLGDICQSLKVLGWESTLLLDIVKKQILGYEMKEKEDPECHPVLQESDLALDRCLLRTHGA